MIRPARSPFCSFAALVSFAVLARADVLVVAPSGGQYTQIQAAVLAATPGDVLLVRTGTYAPVTVGKSLTIQADTTATVVIQGTTTVADLPADGVVVLSGLHGNGLTTWWNDAGAGAGLVLRANAGLVRVQACEFTGALGQGEGTSFGDDKCCNLPYHAEGWDAARVESCTGGTTFTDTLLRGGRGASGYYMCWCGGAEKGGDALYVIGSMVALHECDLLGGNGGSNGTWGGTGGYGLVTTVALGALASNTVIQGGRGGDGLDWLASSGGYGGDGARLGAGTLLQTIGCSVLGNAGGIGWSDHLQAPSGVSVSGPGTLFPYAVPPVEMIVPDLAREATSTTLIVRGAPGAIAAVRFGRRPDFQPLPSWRGVSLVRSVAAPAASRVMLLGPIPASGEVQTTLAITALPAGAATSTWYLQALISDPATGFTLGTGQALTVLDASY